MINPDVKYTATLTLSSVGLGTDLTIEEVTFSPDISDEEIDADTIPCSYRMMSLLVSKMRQRATEVTFFDNDLAHLVEGNDTIN